MREYFIEAGEKIRIRVDTVWTLWFLAKDSLDEGELNQFLDIFEILKRVKANKEDTRLVKNLSTIMTSLTNRYQRYLTNISSQMNEPPIEENLEEQSMQSFSLSTDWNERIKEIKKSYPRAYQGWNEVEEKELIQLFKEGLKPSEISKKLQRQPSAIRSRLRKLGLIE
jgi:DNA-directed RNA polymerase specialized sigma24 family protein